MPEKISDLHGDLEHPIGHKDLPEYDVEKGYPNQYEDVGEGGERSIANRIFQFGITKEELQTAGVETPYQLNSEQYKLLITEALKRQYHTLFASVYGRWAKMEKPEDQLQVVKRVASTYKEWGINLIQKGDQPKTDEPNMLIALEGAHFVRNLGDIDQIYDLGIRSVMVQYNKENALASDEGLTDLGKQAVKKMLDMGIIVDLAHNNPNVRKDIFKMAEDSDQGELLAYTHGAEAEDIAKDPEFASYAEKRGLTKDEVKKITTLGGIIGLGVSKPFYQNIEQVADAIDRIIQMENGPKSLGLGCDWGGVTPVWTLDGIHGAEDVAKIGDVLSDRFGYEDALIKNILRNNIPEWVKGEK